MCCAFDGLLGLFAVSMSLWVYGYEGQSLCVFACSCVYLYLGACIYMYCCVHVFVCAYLFGFVCTRGYGMNPTSK